MNVSRSTFGSWCELVADGQGWRGPGKPACQVPQPLRGQEFVIEWNAGGLQPGSSTAVTASEHRQIADRQLGTGERLEPREPNSGEFRLTD